MKPSLIEKRKWNSYPNKTFKTFKVYDIILNKSWGKFYGLIVFVPKNIHVCLVKSVLVFCIVLQCFLCYFYFIKQHFIKDNTEKKKPRP